MWLEDHFGSDSTLQRNERVKLAASFWNNIGAGMVIGGLAASTLLDQVVTPALFYLFGRKVYDQLALFYRQDPAGR